MPLTRAKVLLYSLTFALRPLSIQARRGRIKVAMTDEEQRLVAEAVVERLKLHGDQWKLDEEIEPFPGTGPVNTGGHGHN